MLYLIRYNVKHLASFVNTQYKHAIDVRRQYNRTYTKVYNNIYVDTNNIIEHKYSINNIYSVLESFLFEIDHTPSIILPGYDSLLKTNQNLRYLQKEYNTLTEQYINNPTDDVLFKLYQLVSKIESLIDRIFIKTRKIKIYVNFKLKISLRKYDKRNFIIQRLRKNFKAMSDQSGSDENTYTTCINIFLTKTNVNARQKNNISFKQSYQCYLA